jgi:hypothetical protein
MSCTTSSTSGTVVVQDSSSAAARETEVGQLAAIDSDIERVAMSEWSLREEERESRGSAKDSGSGREKLEHGGEGESNYSSAEEKPVVTTSPRWSLLLSTTALEDAHLSRASSVTDAHVLRRKGRLKEQDGLIEFIISMHTTHSPFQVGAIFSFLDYVAP